MDIPQGRTSSRCMEVKGCRNLRIFGGRVLSLPAAGWPPLASMAGLCDGTKEAR